MAKKRSSLTDLTSGSSGLMQHVAPKGGAVHDAPAKAAAKNAKEGPAQKHLQIRLKDHSMRALKGLAAEQGESMQDLVVEALNDMMRRHGKAPVIEGPEKEAKD